MPRRFLSGQRPEPRICSAMLQQYPDGSRLICAEPAIEHIAIEEKNTKDGGAWACEEHRPVILDRYDPYAHHQIGDYCGMPGSEWVMPEDECRLPNGLPVTSLDREQRSSREKTLSVT